jgi:hypothetical protein
MSNKKLASSLTKGQQAVLRAFSDFGAMDDTALTVYVHHIADVAMSSSGIRSRRAELARKGLLAVVGVKQLKSGRNAAIHGITRKGEQVAVLLTGSRLTAKAV